MLIAKSKPSAPPVPPGTYVGCIRGVFDGGMQPGFSGGNPQHKIVISVELDKRRADGQRYELNEVVSLSTNEKATLRTKWLKPLLGRDLTVAEVASFDVETMIGKCGLIQVIMVDKEGKQFARVGNIVPLPNGIPAITPERDSLIKPVLAERLWSERIVDAGPAAQSTAASTKLTPLFDDEAVE
jgi:hypothetical protein